MSCLLRRSQKVTTPLGLPKPDEAVQLKDHLLIQAQIPPLPLPVNKDTPPNLFHSQLSVEEITALDRINYRASWKQIFLPQPLLGAQRDQGLSPVNGNPSKTLYEAREVFQGPVGYIVDLLFAEGLQKGFTDQAKALKARAEGN